MALIDMIAPRTQRGGFSLVELLSTCPTNWGMTPVDSLKFVEQHMVPAYPLGDFKVAAGVAQVKV